MCIKQKRIYNIVYVYTYVLCVTVLLYNCMMFIATVPFTFHAFAWPNALPTTIRGESWDLRQFAKAANSEKAAW